MPDQDSRGCGGSAVSGDVLPGRKSSPVVAAFDFANEFLDLARAPINDGAQRASTTVEGQACQSMRTVGSGPLGGAARSMPVTSRT